MHLYDPNWRPAAQPCDVLRRLRAGSSHFYSRWANAGYSADVGRVGCFSSVFIAFKVYVARMSRNEDDQLVLQDSSDHLRTEQEAIMAQLQKTRPVGFALLGLLGLTTVYVAGYYVMDMVRQFK